MDDAHAETETFEQVVSVTRHIISLSEEEQYSAIEGIILGGITAIERQDVSGLQNALQMAVTRAEASMLFGVHGQATEGNTLTVSEEMTVTTTEHPYIVRDPRIGAGEPSVAGTGVRVRILVEYWRAGTSPEDLLLAFPHLTLAQVFDALSYYQDHQPEINALIERNHPHSALLHESVRPRS